ncbi:hypothetical protein NQZ68_012549 [Dissostichus eleginoides]|nr:hypothetical protein NQZ68_012549 [Dissostichus eleginoides]
MATVSGFPIRHFSTETLFCDCQLKWLLLWARSNSLKIGNDTVCVFPTHLHGLEFRNLRQQQLRCVVRDTIRASQDEYFVPPFLGFDGRYCFSLLLPLNGTICSSTASFSRIGIDFSLEIRDPLFLTIFTFTVLTLTPIKLTVLTVRRNSPNSLIASLLPIKDGPLEMPLFQLIPSQRQVVFRGDRLPLQCTASYLDPSVELRWRHNRRMVTTHEDRGIYVEDTLIHDCCLITRYMQRREEGKARKEDGWGNDLKGQDRIGLATCQHLRAICGSSPEVGHPAPPRAGAS